MIPASAISANLSADLSYNPSIHVQTVEIDRTGTNLIAEVTTNYVKWYLSKVSFANMLRIVPGEEDVNNQIFTMDASQGRVMTDASAAILKFATSKNYTIPLYSPDVQYGIDSDLSLANRIGKVGDISVNYQRISLESDASTATTPSSTLTSWHFAASSLTLTINWDADASNVVAVTANAGANLTVNKKYNDAAADFIQIKMEGDAFDPHGRNSSSADIVSSTIDYASKFESHTGGGVDFVAGTPTLTVSDSTLTQALQQAINVDGTSRDVSNNDSLRTVVKEMIELRHLQGFQTIGTIPGSLRATIAGQYASSNDISFSVTPIIFFRYRPPTRFALAETDPYGAGQDGTVLYNSIYVAGIDSSGNLDNIDNIDDGTLTSSLETYDGTTMTADSYEIVGIKHSLFEDPNAAGYSDTSYNTFMYKINFPSQFYLFNYGAARSQDISAVTVNGISLKVGREKSDLTEIYPPTDVNYIYIITQALSQSIEITPIPAVTAEVALATQTSTRGIMSFTGGYDLRITDQYPDATTGTHKVCLYKTTEGVEALVSGAIGTTTIEANSLNKYSFVNSEDDEMFTLWVNGEKQWNVSSIDVANKADLGSIDKLGATFLNQPENRVSGTMQDLKVFDTPLTDTQIEEAKLPKPSVAWTMSSTLPEVGNISLKNGASLATLSFKKSKPVEPKAPSFDDMGGGLMSGASTIYTVGYVNISKSYTFKTALKNFVVDASFTSTDNAHSGSTTCVASGKTATISFPTTNNTSGYTVSNIKLRHIVKGSVFDMDDATHGMTVTSGELWLPPTTSTITASTQSSLPGSYLMVFNKQCSIRCTFTGGNNFHTTTAADLIHSLEYSTNNGTSYSSLVVGTVVTAVNDSNKTIDFNFTATNTNDHMFRMVLKGDDTVTTSYYTFTVPSSGIFTFPTISSTAKLAPHDTADVTVGQALSMESTFNETIHASITTGIVISDGTGNPSISAQSTSGTKYTYSFVVANDADHSATITFTFGTTTNTYSWNAAGLLTAANDIYTFPNYVTYDGTSNGYDSGKHLKEDTASTLVLTFTGGDMLHSDVYGSQVSLIQYKTGSSGSLVTVPSGDVTINSAAGHETITVANITATAVDDVYINITLKGPDGAVMGSPLVATVVNGHVQASIPVTQYKMSPYPPGAPGSFNEATTIPTSTSTFTVPAQANNQPNNFFFVVGDPVTISFNTSLSHPSSSGAVVLELDNKDAFVNSFAYTTPNVSNGVVSDKWIIGPNPGGLYPESQMSVTFTDTTKVYCMFYHGGGYKAVMNLITSGSPGAYNDKARWLTYQGYGNKPSNMNHFFEFYPSGFTSTNLMWNFGGTGTLGVNFVSTSYGYLVWRQLTVQSYSSLNYHLTYSGLRGCEVKLYGRNDITYSQVNTLPGSSGDGWTLVATNILMEGKYDAITLGNYSSVGTIVNTGAYSVWSIVWTSNTEGHGPLFTRVAVNDSVTSWVDDTVTTLLT